MIKLIVCPLVLLLFTLNVFVIGDSNEEWNSCKCGIRPSQQRIVNGEEVFPHAYPWLVALVHSENPTKLMCGGTLLSNRHVLTAGHCFRNFKGVQLSTDKVFARLGAHNLSESSIGLQLSIDQITVFPIFNYSASNLAPIYDVTLIRLNQTVPINNQIRPICLHSLAFAKESKTMLQMLREFDKRTKDKLLPPNLNNLSNGNEVKHLHKREVKAEKVGILFSSHESPNFNGGLAKFKTKVALGFLRKKIRLWDRLANDAIKRYRVVCAKYQAMGERCGREWRDMVRNLERERKRALKDKIINGKGKKSKGSSSNKNKSGSDSGGTDLGKGNKNDDNDDDDDNGSDGSDLGSVSLKAKYQEIIVNKLFNVTNANLPNEQVVGWMYTNELVQGFLNDELEKNRNKKIPIVKQKNFWRYAVRPLFVSGWGSTSTDGSIDFLSDTPRHTALKELAIGKCSAIYGSDIVDVRRSLCNGNHGKDSCAGDSGGPLMSFKYGRANLRGVVSFGDMCGSMFSPSTNTFIDPYISWLLWHMKDDKFCFD